MKSSIFLLPILLPSFAYAFHAFHTYKNHNTITKLKLYREQASQLVAASCSENAYSHRTLIKEQKREKWNKNAQELLNGSKVAQQKDLLSRMISLTPNLREKFHLEDDVYVCPIVGFRWVKTKDSEMVVLPATSCGTRCRLPNPKEEVYGWFNEVCSLENEE